MNDTELVQELLKWQSEKFYSSAQLCQILQINKNTLGNWKQGKSLSPKTRQKIYSLIHPIEDNVEKLDEPIMKFPVISEAAAATANTTYFPASDFAREYAEDYIFFSEGKKGDFVIKVVGDSMSPWYPAGTFLLVRPNTCLRNGDRVVAILADGTILFKIFAEDESFFYLMSENQQEGKDYKFAKNDFNGVRTLYLVLQSMRNERVLDSEKSRQGILPEWKTRIKAIK